MVNVDVKTNEKIDIESNEKPKRRRRLRVGDPDFVPPDGGWGWLVVFACGFSNLCNFPMFQQFGLVFREKFEYLGISNTETTTVININSAFNACVGGQVAMFGSLLVFSSLFFTTQCSSFWGYLILYSACYGSGIGITQSSNALALNTYFKEKRRVATSLSWSTTGLGPIVWPYIITPFIDYYGTEGTLLIFSAFALHSFMCSLLLQPVEWHTQFRKDQTDGAIENGTKDKVPQLEIYDGKLSKTKKSRSLLSSQYLYNEDDPINKGYEITDPGTPMMVRANDGWYSQSRSQMGSRISLSSNKTNKGTTSRIPSGQNSVSISKRPSYSNLIEARSRKNSSLNLVQDGKERKRERKISIHKPSIQEEVEEANVTEKTVMLDEKRVKQHLDVDDYPVDSKKVLKSAAKKLEAYKEEENKKLMENGTHEHEENPDHEYQEVHMKHTLLEKIYIFFDFDLFKDHVYVNLMLGITIANFAELNFSILTPMVLKEFDFGKYEIATFMSLLGATDIVVRFMTPFIASHIPWDNKTFFLVGVLGMAFGRIVLVHTQTYSVSLLVAIIIGAGKGFRTIFMALVIPSHVSLEKLPAASGLQLATSGLLFLILGPVVGWIRDLVNNYVITLHLLNLCTYFTAIAWTVEGYLSRKKKQKEVLEEASIKPV